VESDLTNAVVESDLDIEVQTVDDLLFAVDNVLSVDVDAVNESASRQNVEESGNVTEVFLAAFLPAAHQVSVQSVVLLLFVIELRKVFSSGFIRRGLVFRDYSVTANKLGKFNFRLAFDFSRFLLNLSLMLVEEVRFGSNGVDFKNFVRVDFIVELFLANSLLNDYGSSSFLFNDLISLDGFVLNDGLAFSHFFVGSRGMFLRVFEISFLAKTESVQACNSIDSTDGIALLVLELVKRVTIGGGPRAGSLLESLSAFWDAFGWDDFFSDGGVQNLAAIINKILTISPASRLNVGKSSSLDWLLVGDLVFSGVDGGQAQKNDG